MNKQDIEDALAQVTFAPSCVDMGWVWEVKALFEECEPIGYLIRTTFVRPDRDSGRVKTGFGRWWHVPPDVTESGVVKTAFKAALLILEHELMESFRYGGVRLFDPHHDLEDLTVAAKHRELSIALAAAKNITLDAARKV